MIFEGKKEALAYYIHKWFKKKEEISPFFLFFLEINHFMQSLKSKDIVTKGVFYFLFLGVC